MNLSLTRPFLLAIAVLVTVAGWQLAQAQGTSAELRGLVKDPSTNVVPGAEVRVQNLDTGLSSNGAYLLRTAPTVSWA